jgi:hypothetical protein
MKANGSGAGLSTNGKTGATKAPAATERCRRRVVLLMDGDQGGVAAVLLEMPAAEVSGNRLHAELQRLAYEHAGAVVAAEWIGPLGWTRFLWCHK